MTSTSPALVESRYAPFGVRATRFIFDGLIVSTIWSSMLLLKYLALFVPTGAPRPSQILDRVDAPFTTWSVRRRSSTTPQSLGVALAPPIERLGARSISSRHSC